MPAEEQARRRSQKLKAESRPLAPASAVLQGLLDDAPADQFTLVWLLGHLHRCSFGFIMLLLALVAMLPGISIVAGLLLVVPALEMIAGRVAPVFPRRFLSLPTRYLARAVRRAHPGSEVSREGDPSALAHSVGGYQKCRRRRSPATDRAATARAGANDPGRAGFGDRVNLTGLPRGGRSPALDRAPHRRRSPSNHGGGGLENGRRRRLDRPILALVRLHGLHRDALS